MRNDLNQDSFKFAHETDDIDGFGQSHNGIPDELPGTMPGNLSAAVNVDDGRAVCWALVETGSFARGVDRFMLQQEKGVVTLARDDLPVDFALDFPCFAIGNLLFPHGKVLDVPHVLSLFNRVRAQGSPRWAMRSAGLLSPRVLAVWSLERNACLMSSVSVPGYRLVRPLEEGRAWLCRPLTRGKTLVARAVEENGWRARLVDARHAIRIHDVVRSDDGTVWIVEEWCERGPLAHYWSKALRTPGEGVTALIPVLEYLDDMSSAGWLFPQLNLGDLLVDGDSCVRVSACSRAVSFSTSSGADVAQRRKMWGDSAQHFLEVAAILAPNWTVQQSRPRVAMWREWQEELLAWCEPSSLSEPLANSHVTSPQRIGGIERGVFSRAEVNVAENDLLPARASSVISRFNGRIRELVTVLPLNREMPRRPEASSSAARFGIRRPLIVGSLLTLLFVVGALLLMPKNSGSAEALNSATSQPAMPPGESSAGTESPVDSARGSESSDQAAVRLWNERRVCLLKGICTVSVQKGSSLDASDSERQLLGETWTLNELPRAHDAEVVSDMGGIALITVRTEKSPASVLVVETEAGWQLREILN